MGFVSTAYCMALDTEYHKCVCVHFHSYHIRLVGLSDPFAVQLQEHMKVLHSCAVLMRCTRSPTIGYTTIFISFILAIWSVHGCNLC